MGDDKRISIGHVDVLHKLFGNLDENIILIEKAFGVKIVARDGDLVIIGESDDNITVEKLIHQFIGLIKKGDGLDRQQVEYAIAQIKTGDDSNLENLTDAVLCMTAKGKAIKPKTHGQMQYVAAIQKRDVTFGVGPAGTGKTYLAVAMAVRAFKNNEVSRIIITRPAVEAGENLGFLPGDLQMKIDPYLRPVHDALFDILGGETYVKLKERGQIEVAPLAYMRGRTLDNAFIILDEAQNTTKEQMKMFLTRFGYGSKVVVNGDITQIDLPTGRRSGLVHAIEVLKDVEEIAQIRFTEKDVVRHSLVRRIITEYDKYDRKHGSRESNQPLQINRQGHK